MKKVSVIVPVYNGSKFLKKTIESLLNQDYHNIEILLIDDGSTDNSKEICLDYQKKDSRIFVHSQSNKGISCTRNKGIELASGDYIAFMDQDDAIDKHIYSILVNALEESEVDMALSGKTMQLIDQNDKVIKNIDFEYEDSLITNEGILLEIFNWDQKGRILQIWNCLYKKSLIDQYHIRFNTSLKKGQEDTLFNIEYAFRCKKIHTVPKIVYRYFRRAAVSTSLKSNDAYLNDYNSIVSILYQNANRISLPQEFQYIFQAYAMRLGISLFRQYRDENNCVQQFDKVINIIEKYTGKLNIRFKSCRNKKLAAYLILINKCYKLGFHKMAIRLVLMK